MTTEQVSICVIGSGYVGLVAAVCFADMGHSVVCVDNDEAKVKMLREGGVPIFEDHLESMLAKHLGRGVRANAFQNISNNRWRKSSSHPARLNFPRREPFDPSFCMALMAMCRSTARLCGPFPMRVRS